MKTKETILTHIPRSLTYKRLDDGLSLSGKCYETSDGRLFKKYKYQIDYYNVLNFIANNYQCNHLVLPEEFLFLNSISEKNFIGYLRKLVKGDTFENLNDNINMVKFIKALQFLETEMIKNSRYGLIYLDINSQNMFYTPQDEIKVIDQDLYEVSYDEDIKHRISENLKELADTIISKFFDYGKYNDKRISKNILKCASHVGGILKPSELLCETADIFEQTYEGQILTLGDFRKKVQLSKEK